MRIAVISNWFSEKMGYAENCLPRSLAALGHEVHLVTSNAQPYFDSAIYPATYEPFIGPGIVDCGTRHLDGYTLHRLPFAKKRGQVRILRLGRVLQALRAEVVQTFDAYGPIADEVAWTNWRPRFKMFLESHVHASVFPPIREWAGLRNRARWLLYAATWGRFISRRAERCYAISEDAAEIAIQFFGIEPRKVQIFSLGVDTALFRPASSGPARQERRAALGFKEWEIVCIYTGRFSEDKDALCLARAVALLAEEGRPVRGLFVGGGAPEAVAAIRACRGCVVHPFVPTQELPRFYWAADVGVWPKQESTSQLDAMACALPIVVSDRVRVRERHEGNGLTYQEGDARDLARSLASLAEPGLRRMLGEAGARKVRERFSWDAIALQRCADYEASLDEGKR